MTVYESPHGQLELRDLSVTERVFEGLALGDPDRIVLSDAVTGDSLTAAELEADIRALAGGLSEAGWGAGATIAILAPNMPAYVTVFHGAAFAGATITTINPSYTAPEVAHQLQDSGAQLLVTVSAALETAQAAVSGMDMPIAVIDGDGEANGAMPLSSLMSAPLAAQVPVDLDTHVLALPYSSGTTGLPKGVMLSHRNLVVNVDQALVPVPVYPGEMTVAFLPFFHIYGLTVMMNMYLSAGAGLVTMPRFDLETLLRAIQDHKMRMLCLVPPVALVLAKHPLVEEFDLSALKVVISGAAPLGSATTDAISTRLGCTAMQAYGMTEMSPVSHACCDGYLKPGSIGALVPGTAARIVVPETGQDAAPGGKGELWIKGPQVMLGYHGNPAATAETMAEGGWLRTGDLASVDENGSFAIHDRLKELIKMHGFQVAPAEVEAVLLEHPNIQDAAVLGRADDTGDEAVVAYVVTGDGQVPDLAAHCEARLAHYKHPAKVYSVDAIPKSASGKILRRVLRDAAAPGA
ncbi:AMP-binding protein [Meridianimarinicoccus aquatilis]|uniref:4-coumarate--CoA ligase family protein n=1 Tax=Meridianimarinicoccus aquatilis TaxID=2552766 RepID=A0A4R6B0I1_9RHOB|nr:AMP-binding protein [Fluviibacterium aquatile]TDL90621.1 4-coumarate--CoA ligase family protein [Fluviibacterium aquatile]